MSENVDYSNQTNPDQAEHSTTDSAPIQRAFERARHTGFEPKVALQLDHPELSEHQLAKRQEQVAQTAADLLEKYEISHEFFDNDANSILLASAADSWLGAEENARLGHTSDVMAEKKMLEDVLLIMAGKNSGYVQKLAQENPEEAGRFLDSGETDTGEHELKAFYESIVDDELSTSLQEVFNDKSPGSLLEEQRAALAVDEGNEQAFRVRVIKMGEMYDFVSAGELTPIVYPEPLTSDASPEERAKYRQESIASQDEYHRRHEWIKPYKEAREHYDQTFSSKFGPMREAFVMPGQSGPEIFIKAPDAVGLLKHQLEPGEPAEPAISAIRNFAAIIRHEYTHTQKMITLGAHSQLGLVLEERKAEALSDDKMGYQDIKYMFTDLGVATGKNPLGILKKSMLSANPTANFLAEAANNYGLRNALLLMAAKPGAYEEDKEYAKKFADTACLVDAEEGGSVLDAIVSYNISKHGEAKIQENAAEWAQRAKIDNPEGFFHYRRHNGAKAATAHLEQAYNAHHT